MSALIEKIRKARQSSVKAGEWTFTVSRPTDMDVLNLRAAEGGTTNAELLRRFVVGWSGVREIDLVPGGSPDPVPFSAELFAEFVADRPALWEPIVKAIIEGYKAHESELEAAAKNSTPG